MKKVGFFLEIFWPVSGLFAASDQHKPAVSGDRKTAMNADQADWTDMNGSEISIIFIRTDPLDPPDPRSKISNLQPPATAGSTDALSDLRTSVFITAVKPTIPKHAAS